MEDLAEIIARIAAGMKAKNLNQPQLGELLGVSKETVHQFLNSPTTGRGTGRKHWSKIAKIIGCSIEWLTTGTGEPPIWYARPPLRFPIATGEAQPRSVHPRASHRGLAAPSSAPSLAHSLRLVGTVAAGDGDVEWAAEPQDFNLPDLWAVMKVEGDSAYPVVYAGQYVIVDRGGRPVRHNNLVIIQARKPDGGARSFLKRYCVAEESPTGYVLASVDAGRDSPYIKHEDILVMLPVVGVIYERG